MSDFLSLPEPEDDPEVLAARDRLRTKRRLGEPFVQNPPPNRFAGVHQLAARLRAVSEEERRDRELAGIREPGPVRASNILGTAPVENSYPIPPRE